MEQKSKRHVDRKGNVQWKLLNGKFHRLDGPAAEWINGTKAWYVNGKLHRLDGPAVEWADGDKAWYVDDKQHRLDGPAVDCRNGIKLWYVNDVKYNTFQSYLEAVKPLISEQEYFVLLLTYGTEK